MGFVVLHMEKAHGSDSGTTAHIERFIIPKNADPTRTHLNRKLVTYPDGIKDRTAAIQKRLEEAGLTRKIGNNQVRAIRINVSGTHEDMKRIEREGRLDEWCGDNMKYFADLFGRENIVAAHLHRDEETPHIHVTLVPIVKGERKRKKREEQAKKRYRKKPANAVRLCADDIMTRLKLKSYQDSYAVAMAKYGLQRGIDGSQARHKSTQQYYRDIQKLAGSLKSEVVDLQKLKTEAEQELRRAKKEVQTVGVTGKVVTSSHGVPVTADLTQEELSLNGNVEMIVLPGGMPGTLNEEASEVVQNAIAFCAANDRYIGAICAAPSILGHLGLLQGKTAVCYTGFEKDLKGAAIGTDGVVTDGKIITARGAGVALEFGLALIAALDGQAASDAVRASILMD